MGVPSHLPTRPPGGVLPAVLAVVGSALLAGCSGGGVQGSVVQAVEQGASSVATAQLAVDLDESGRLTSAATSTALDDALEELGKARTDVLELSATVHRDREMRDEALAVLDECVSAVSRTTEAVSSRDGQPAVVEGAAALESAAARLADLEIRWGIP
jgi:hypothetical protein